MSTAPTDGKGEVLYLETTHSDEDPGTQFHVPPKQQSRLRRKFDRRMMPIVCTLYVLSYLDRGNIGNAKTAGLQDDLNLSSSQVCARNHPLKGMLGSDTYADIAKQWTWVLNGFYIAYVLMEWTTLLWKIFPAHVYVACLCLA
jgi:hypothetical protein